MNNSDRVQQVQQAEVVIIGAGPAGALAAALLRKAGRSVLVLEKQHFPRFSIGESLLPQSMAYLEEAGLLQTVVEAGFQYKNGVKFLYRDQRTDFDFREKFSEGWSTTYQVDRATFDNRLIQGAMAKGAEVRFGHGVTAVRPGQAPELDVIDQAGHAYTVQARFVLDASGFGRVLPRLLGLETSTGMPTRAAIFSHVADCVPAGDIDRTKIHVHTFAERRDVWFWLIPLAGQRFSVGCVADADFLEVSEAEREQKLRGLLRSEPTLRDWVGEAPFLMPVNRIGGYAANVERLHGDGYALLGNAGEFLDPVFSSGVTIALRSAHMAVAQLLAYLDGQAVDWENQYDKPLRKGIDTFRVFVERWYTGELQDIIYYPHPSKEIKSMIGSILAGYAWDERNPYVAAAERRLKTLHEICQREIR